MKDIASDLADYDVTGDSLVLASVASPAELDLLNDWVAAQRRAHPGATIEVLQLPGQDEPPVGAVAQLVEQLEDGGEDRSVVPVRVFWVPGGLPTRVAPRHAGD